MKRKSMVLGGSLVAAAILLTAGLTSCTSVQPQPEEPVVQVPHVPIFVASEEIPAGEPVTSERLKLKQWPEGQLPTGTLSRLEQVTGQAARVTIPSGEPVLQDKLVAIR